MAYRIHRYLRAAISALRWHWELRSARYSDMVRAVILDEYSAGVNDEMSPKKRRDGDLAMSCGEVEKATISKLDRISPHPTVSQIPAVEVHSPGRAASATSEATMATSIEIIADTFPSAATIQPEIRSSAFS